MSSPNVPLPMGRRPTAPNAAGGIHAVKFVPDYAIESNRKQGVASSISGVDVILALIQSGATFTEKTGCNSGTPYTYWAPEWTADPTP